MWRGARPNAVTSWGCGVCASGTVSRNADAWGTSLGLSPSKTTRLRGGRGWVPAMPTPPAAATPPSSAGYCCCTVSWRSWRSFGWYTTNISHSRRLQVGTPPMTAQREKSATHIANNGLARHRHTHHKSYQQQQQQQQQRQQPGARTYAQRRMAAPYGLIPSPTLVSCATGARAVENLAARFRFCCSAMEVTFAVART